MAINNNYFAITLADQLSNTNSNDNNNINNNNNNNNDNNNNNNNNKCEKCRNKRTFMKKAVLHTTTLIYCKTRQALCNLFITNQGNGSEMKLVAGATKINLKNLMT